MRLRLVLVQVFPVLFAELIFRRILTRRPRLTFAWKIRAPGFAIICGA